MKNIHNILDTGEKNKAQNIFHMIPTFVWNVFISEDQKYILSF